MTVTDVAPVKKSPVLALILMCICALAGVCVMAFPLVATQLNNWEQAKIAQNFPAPNESDYVIAQQAMEEARAYNDRAIQSVTPSDPWSGVDPASSPEFEEYLGVLNQYPAMAQISIPSLSVNLPVYHGTSDTTLLKGAGHLFGTALPVGGVGLRPVITAHTGLPEATLFDNLDKIKIGDAVYLRTIGEDFKYEVINREIILPHEVERIAPVADKDLITLITCTPYGINTHRILVTAERRPMDPVESKEAFTGNGVVIQWWMKIVIASIIGLLLILVTLMLWALKLRREKKGHIG